MTPEPLPPPIPPPGGDVCANCGAEVNRKNEFCVNCGARLRKTSKTNFWDFVPLWIPVLLSLMFGAFGACSLLFAIPNIGVYTSDFFSHRDAIVLFVLGSVSLVLAIVLLVFVAARKERR